MPLKELGVTGDAVTTIEVLDARGDQALAPGALVFVKSPGALVTVWGVVYFEMVREPALTPLHVPQ
jgi:hypothetical protein